MVEQMVKKQKRLGTPVQSSI